MNMVKGLFSIKQAFKLSRLSGVGVYDAEIVVYVVYYEHKSKYSISHCTFKDKNCCDLSICMTLCLLIIIVAVAEIWRILALIMSKFQKCL